jgi:flagellar assembly protein FliH
MREQQSFERGRREADQAWKDDLLRQRSELSKLETSLLESLRQVLPQIARDAEGALIALALEVARKLVADLPVSSDMVEAAIREALMEVEENNEMTILLHPADLELLQAHDSSLFQTKANGERLNFDTSTEVTRGGCLVRTNFGIIDGRRETKLELLKRSLAA